MSDANAGKGAAGPAGPAGPAGSAAPAGSATEAALAVALQDHWAPLLRQLTAYSGRFDLAEDALATAFERAVTAWAEGEPTNPRGWLYLTAKNALIDAARTEQVLHRKKHLIARDETQTDLGHDDTLSRGLHAPDGHDDRIELLWLACHPALAAEVRPVLALRFVLGLDTTRIASLFFVSTPTLAARLTRAKRRVAAAGLAMAHAPSSDPDRAEAVAEALYLAYTAAYYAPDDAAADDVVRLIAHTADVVPHAALQALAALTQLTHARRFARTGADGALITLARQDRHLWRHDEIAAGLRRYAAIEPQSGYAEELRIIATIAAAHSLAARHDSTDWRLIDNAYAKLEALTDSPVARLNRQAARASAGEQMDPSAIARLERDLPGHHRVHVLSSHLHRQAGDERAAAEALLRAIDACESPHERAALQHQHDAIASA